MKYELTISCKETCLAAKEPRVRIVDIDPQDAQKWKALFEDNDHEVSLVVFES